MKILFFCGSLEPGRDGVGDYTQRLGGELSRQGSKVSIIAINDRYLHKEFIGTQVTDGITIPVLRLPFTWSAKRRFAKAHQWIKKFSPDWISLQFVPFSYQKKGLPFGFAANLKRISGNAKLHIMFHELWLGIDKEASLKHLLWGRVQRMLIRNILKTLKPRMVNTQTQLYLQKLKELGYSEINRLPLFGNVPLSLEEKKIHDKNLRFIMFGTIHPGAPVLDFLQELDSYSHQKKVKISFIIMGRSGNEIDRWLHAIGKKGFNVQVLGEQSLEKISDILSKGSLGISTTPLAQIEKSGTVAAMLEHGLPVICVARSWTPTGLKSIETPAGVQHFRRGNLESCLSGHETPLPIMNYSLQKVAQQFYLSLQL